MSHWVQIDLLDAIAEAEAQQKKAESGNENLYPWEHGEVCRTWDDAVANEYGDFTERYYVFQGGTVKEHSKVLLIAALQRPNLYYAFGVTDNASAAYQPIFKDESQTDGVFDGVDDIMMHVSTMLKAFCNGYNVQQKHIDKVLNDFKKKITEQKEEQ